MGKKRNRVRDFLWRHSIKIAFVVMLAFVGLIAYVGWNYVIITNKFDSSRRWDLPSRVYSDATPIVPGLSYPRALLEPKLNHVGYHEVSGRVANPGEYRYVGDDLEIWLQPFRYPDVEFHGMPVAIDLNGSTVRSIRRLDDEVALRAIRIEPELVTSLFDDVMEDRIPVPLDAVSPHLVNAVIAGEDRAFFRHEGISLKGIARAAFENVRSGEIRSGGSTITQQLVKNLYLTQDRAFSRKLREVVMALILEARYSKEQILEAYLNQIYLGQNGSVQVVGVERASQVYFGKKSQYLTLAESATLAGLIPYPNGYSPFKYPDRAVTRRNLVLGSMLEEKMITQQEHDAAKSAELRVNRFHRTIRSAPYFVDLVLKQLRETYPETQLKTEGLRIFTTLDTIMQRSAEQALADGLAGLRKRYRHVREANEPLQGSVLTIQPGTGYVKALIGGTDYQRSQFNRAFQARRQPGSLFKPFVYVAAMDRERGSEALTASTILDDSPISIQTGNKLWQPQNYDKQFHGPVTLRKALAHSYNIPAVRAAVDAGVPNVIRLASSVGVVSRLEPYPSISLGSFEVTPLEIAYAYSVFANEGVKAEPVTILAVSTREGKLLESREVKMTRVTDPNTTYVLNDILKDVLDYGTAARVRSLGFRRPFAGKTGTTNSYRDAWFVGYSPKVLSLVWIGYDDGQNVRLSGSAAAVPIWTDHMNRVAGMVPDVDFRRPDGVVEREIDTTTGLLSTPYCPESQTEVYVAGTQPDRACDYHAAFSEPLYPWIVGEREGWREQRESERIPEEPEEIAGQEGEASEEEPQKKRKPRLRRLLDWFRDQ